MRLFLPVMRSQEFKPFALHCVLPFFVIIWHTFTEVKYVITLSWYACLLYTVWYGLCFFPSEQHKKRIAFKTFFLLVTVSSRMLAFYLFNITVCVYCFSVLPLSSCCFFHWYLNFTMALIIDIVFFSLSDSVVVVFEKKEESSYCYYCCICVVVVSVVCMQKL